MIKIFVKVKSNAKENKVDKIDDINFRIFVKEPPVRGRANAAVIKMIAQYFNLPSAKIQIVSGFNSRQKIIEITK